MYFIKLTYYFRFRKKKKGSYLRHIVTQNVMLIAKKLDRYLKANKGATNVNLLLVEMNCTRL